MTTDRPHKANLAPGILPVGTHLTPLGLGLQQREHEIMGVGVSDQWVNPQAYFDIGPELIAAYTPRTAGIQTGLVERDQAMRTYISRGRQDMLQLIGVNASSLAYERFNPLHGIPLTANRYLERREIVEGLRPGGKLDAMRRAVSRDDAGGIVRSPALETAADTLMLTLMPEMKVGERVEATARLEPTGEDAKILGTTEVMTFMQAIAILREKGLVDLSPEAVDARVAWFYRLAAMELGCLALGDLMDLGFVSGKNSGAVLDIYKRYKDQLFGSKITPALDMLTDISFGFGELAASFVGRREADAREYCTAKQRDCSSMVSDMVEFEDVLRTAYKNLGPRYPLPPQLPDVAGEGNSRGAADEAVVDAEAVTAAPTEVARETIAAAGLARAATAEARARALKQLNAIILPRSHEATGEGTRREQIQAVARQVAAENPGLDAGVVWPRMEDLMNVADFFGVDAFRTTELLGGREPYFITVFEINGDTYVYAESPIFGDASYLYSEKHGEAEGGWLKALDKRTRKEARAEGAVAVRHSKLYPYGSGHVRKILSQLEEWSGVDLQDQYASFAAQQDQAS